MIRRYHLNISFKWFDFWIGWFFDVRAKVLYICLLPTLPIKLWMTDHAKCPNCGSAMEKTAYDISPEGYDLQWNCEVCEENGEESRIWIDWNMDFRHLEYIGPKDLERFGYRVV